MWVNEKSSAQFVYVRLSVWLGWPQASPREPLRCHISSLVIVETLKYSGKKRKQDRQNNALLSPGVKSDLEALRRAQAFGEAAGADVFVKIKKTHPGLQQEQDEPKQKLPKALRVSKWDNVLLFFEVYLNQ